MDGKDMEDTFLNTVLNLKIRPHLAINDLFYNIKDAAIVFEIEIDLNVVEITCVVKCSYLDIMMFWQFISLNHFLVRLYILRYFLGWIRKFILP